MRMLEGRTALVTGAGRGNGAAIARGLADAGARVVLADLDLAATEAVAAEVGARARGAQLDVTDAAQAEALAATLAADGWGIDLLVNNAGICPRVPVEAESFEQAWDLTLSVNLTGMMRVTRAFLPQLKALPGATVVNVSSIAAFVNAPSSLAYPASKAGVRGLTYAMAGEFAAWGIRVNAIAPGQFDTPMLAPSLADPERRRAIQARILLGRVGDPDELAGPVIFLSSVMSSFVTGVTLAVDGGFLTT